MTKRLLDISLSLVALIVLLPILPILALAIIVSDGFPIFFRQKRVGRGGREFVIYKFRTMYIRKHSSDSLITVRADVRIFPAGRYLRKFKIDELPQLFNVLIGNMSFVGPRPEVPFYVAKYTREQRKVLELQPGMTDVATLEFMNEEGMLAGSDDPNRFYLEYCLPRKIALNLEYAKNASFVSDIVVVFKTLFSILGHKV
jgi:lipopolysaccharide/colanic/teichoic acid biosynthesis glycosyltransferase